MTYTTNQLQRRLTIARPYSGRSERLSARWEGLLDAFPSRLSLVVRCVPALVAAAIGGCGGTVVPAETPAAPPIPPEVREDGLPSSAFVVDSKPFCFAGANNYYLSFKPVGMALDVFAQARAMGLKVLRTWAFAERGSLDSSVPSVDGDGTKEGMYFQYFDPASGSVMFNDSASGLERLDRVVASAASHGLKLTLVLTNNWKDFGGIDQYVRWFSLPTHHSFYTDARARQAYKDWVRHVLTRTNSVTGVRYADDPAIFAWELANEPRCGNGGDFDRTSECSSQMITSWASEMSSYIKSIDKNHLVAVGDEGFFQWEAAEHWLYDGSHGVDHEALLQIESIDFGTFHLYPDHWGQDAEWGERWIREHLQAAHRAFKPTVLEEYGLLDEQLEESSGQAGPQRRRLAYEAWNQDVMSGGGSGAMFWHLVGLDPRSPSGYVEDHDQLAVYNLPQDGSATALAALATRFSKEARACAMADAAQLSVPNSPFVQVAGFLNRPEPAKEPVLPAEMLGEQ